MMEETVSNQNLSFEELEEKCGSQEGKIKTEIRECAEEVQDENSV